MHAGTENVRSFGGGLNRSTQHFYLEGEMECGLMAHKFHRGLLRPEKTECMGSLEARRVTKGDRTSFWQAVIVDLFFWWPRMVGFGLPSGVAPGWH